MNTTMIRENQELVDEAYDQLSESTYALSMGTTNSLKIDHIAVAEYLSKGGLDIDRAIRAAHKGLSALYKLQYIRDAEVTVNLSLSDDANGVAESVTPVLATESPVIRALPVTDKITPIVRMPHPLQLASAAS